ncbi:MAG: hypothetical protein NVS9B4_15050 [Candidatus Acidiferrum sp.]
MTEADSTLDNASGLEPVAEKTGREFLFRPALLTASRVYVENFVGSVACSVMFYGALASGGASNVRAVIELLAGVTPEENLPSEGL